MREDEAREQLAAELRELRGAAGASGHEPAQRIGVVPGLTEQLRALGT